MGAQWKVAGKVAKAASKGALVSKLVKEIMVASRLGGPDPDHNARLRAAVEAAKKNSVPRDTIERGIKKGAGLLDEAVQYETVLFEGFAPHRVPLIIECLTDNRNRTSSNVKSYFGKKGQLGSIGSVAWMFDRIGLVEATHKDGKLDIESAAIEAGAQNVEPLPAPEVEEGSVGARFICDPSDLDTVSKFLSGHGWVVTTNELAYMAKDFPELTEAQKKEVAEFLHEIDEDDDVHRVHAALK